MTREITREVYLDNRGPGYEMKTTQHLILGVTVIAALESQFLTPWN